MHVAVLSNARANLPSQGARRHDASRVALSRACNDSRRRSRCVCGGCALLLLLLGSSQSSAVLMLGPATAARALRSDVTWSELDRQRGCCVSRACTTFLVAGAANTSVGVPLFCAGCSARRCALAGPADACATCSRNRAKQRCVRAASPSSLSFRGACGAGALCAWPRWVL